MKSFSLALLAASPALGHYFFPNTIVDGVESANWEFVREPENNPGSHPIEDVSSGLMGCNEKPGRPASGVLTIAAGSEIGLRASASMGHPGPSLWYMAKVPEGQDVDAWDPSGAVWFKIDENGNTPDSWPPFVSEMSEISTTIPSGIAAGNYLLRYEHIGLHIAGGPQFYVTCVNLEVTGGGSTSPSNLVAFPGAYSASDPGLTFDIYAQGSTPYPYPGPSPI